MYVPLGKIMDKKLQKRPNTQLPLLKSLEQKHGTRSKSRVLRMPPVHNTNKGVGKPPKSLFQPDPWTCPYPHPI